MGKVLSVVLAAVVLVVGLDISRGVIAKSEPLPMASKLTGEVATLPSPGGSPEAVSASVASEFPIDYHLSEVCDCETLTRRMQSLEDRVKALEVSALSVPKYEAPKPVEVATLPPSQGVPLGISLRSGHWTIRDVPASRASMNQIVSHLAEHGLTATGTREEMLEMHDRAHEGTLVSSGSSMVKSTTIATPVRSAVSAVRSACPGGVCPTRSSSYSQPFRLFRRR